MKLNKIMQRIVPLYSATKISHTINGPRPKSIINGFITFGILMLLN